MTCGLWTVFWNSQSTLVAIRNITETGLKLESHTLSHTPIWRSLMSTKVQQGNRMSGASCCWTEFQTVNNNKLLQLFIFQPLLHIGKNYVTDFKFTLLQCWIYPPRTGSLYCREEVAWWQCITIGSQVYTISKSYSAYFCFEKVIHFGQPKSHLPTKLMVFYKIDQSIE